MTAILGLLLILAGLALAYLAGAHDRHRAKWDPDVALQMDRARLRHPAGR